MTRKECYAVLELPENADLSEIKRAYRKLAFSLHPDLNPDVPDAARRFQRVNEAYVLLSQEAGKARRNPSAETAKDDDGPSAQKARDDARKAYEKAKSTQKDAGPKSAEAFGAQPQEDVLKDILNDPFARRVFEDIYSHIRHEAQAKSVPPKGSPKPDYEPSSKKAPARSKSASKPEPPGFMGKLKGWFQKQLDDEQVLRLPGESLVPGARVRLQIQHGLGGEPQTVELTLPPEFVPGKAMRLRGLGKRLGGKQGDLYIRIEAE